MRRRSCWLTEEKNEAILQMLLVAGCLHEQKVPGSSVCVLSCVFSFRLVFRADGHERGDFQGSRPTDRPPATTNNLQ